MSVVDLDVFGHLECAVVSVVTLEYMVLPSIEWSVLGAFVCEFTSEAVICKYHVDHVSIEACFMMADGWVSSIVEHCSEGIFICSAMMSGCVDESGVDGLPVWTAVG